QLGEFALDQLAETLHAHRLDDNLDARLELVVANTVLVVHAQDRSDVRQQVRPVDRFADALANHRRATETATGVDIKRHLVAAADDLDADVMGTDQGGVLVRHRIDGDLELARQVCEFRVEGRPLADQFAPGAWILDLFRVGAGVFVGGGVAHAVAAGLDGVHLNAGQFGKDIRHVFQFRPVQLDVLARGHVGVALVPLAGNLRQLAYLGGRQHAVGHSDTQHRCIALDIQAVLQAQDKELSVAQLAFQKAAGLVTELGDTLVQQLLVIGLVHIHRAKTCMKSGRETRLPRWMRTLAKALYAENYNIQISLFVL